MELLSFYLESIFYFLEFPTASDICKAGNDITYSCTSVINFTLTYSAILIIFTIFISKNLKSGFKFLIFSLISIISIFIIANIILLKLASQAIYGLESFIIVFYFWIFAIFSLHLASLFFFEKKRKLISSALIITILAIIACALFGRGTAEQYVSIIGGFGELYELGYFADSDIFKLIVIISAITLMFSLLHLATTWIKESIISPITFFRNFPILIIFVILIATITISIPLGDLINKRDISAAQRYIETIQKKVDKYHLENGEYPKFIADMIDEEADNPWLLKRHEYFTLGIRGTYYFSRAQKYCFLFQNPSANFGYHSLTSTRGWHKYSETNSFGNVYLSMCDEAYENEETLFADHFGMDSLNDDLFGLSYQFNSPNNLPETRAASPILHNKIIDYGNNVDPDVFKYYRNAPTNVEE